MKNRIRELRKNLGMTQEELAGAVGVTRQTIIALERDATIHHFYLHRIKLALKERHIEDVFILEDHE